MTVVRNETPKAITVPEPTGSKKPLRIPAVTLEPGANTVADEHWDVLSSVTSVRALLDVGALTVVAPDPEEPAADAQVPSADAPSEEPLQ